MHKLHIISGQHEDGGSGTSQLKKGILWQQRDKIFSRWKERFFVLTKDYLQCFKKGTSRITEMGGFIYGIRLSDVSFFQDFYGILYNFGLNSSPIPIINFQKKTLERSIKKLWNDFLDTLRFLKFFPNISQNYLSINQILI